MTVPLTVAPDDTISGRTENWLAPGTEAARVFVVGERDTAMSMGGDLPVLATPVLIGWVEMVASDLIRERSSGERGSVGIRVDIRHTGPAAPGDRVKVAVNVQSMVFQTIRFTVTATHDETHAVLLGGEHDRALVRRPV
jgi:fluoroacetyl-CoA thioesterase